MPIWTRFWFAPSDLAHAERRQASSGLQTPRQNPAQGNAEQADAYENDARQHHLGGAEPAPDGALETEDSPLHRTDIARPLHPRRHGNERNHAATRHRHDEHHGPRSATHGALGLAEVGEEEHETGEAERRDEHGRREGG